MEHIARIGRRTLLYMLAMIVVVLLAMLLSEWEPCELGATLARWC